MIKIDPFCVTYGKTPVLTFPGITLEKGKVYAIIGSNGSGKSTFAKVLAGVVSADRKVKPIGNVKTGYMPQKNYAFRMNVLSNILLGGKDTKMAGYLMDKLKISHLKDKSAKTLSGGETAKMALARLMMGEYDVVILDEPTSAMDMESSLLTEELIDEYVRRTGCCLIIITHNIRQAVRISDEVLYFHKGTLLEYGDKDTVLNTPKNEETKTFLEYFGK